MIPLINVVFLLLIFFMIAGSLERFEVLQVEPPLATSSEEMSQGALVIVLGRHDEVLFNDELVTPLELVPLLREQLAYNRERLVTIKADARLPAPRLIALFQKVREAGGTNLTLATQAP